MVDGCKRSAIVLLVFLVSASTAFAQQRGSILGKVTDPAGLGVPGATITVTEQGTGFTRTAISAENGAYTLTNLEPGTYSLVVDLSGFGPMKREGLTLTAGAE